MQRTRPRLTEHAVVLHRGDSVQIGIHPDRALVIDHPPPGLIQFLDHLDGRDGPAELARRADELAIDWPALADALREHRLLVESEPVIAARVEVITADHWGLQIAELLLSSGVEQVGLVLLQDDSQLTHQAHRLARRRLGRVLVRHDWTTPDGAGSIAIINTATAETDRAIAAACAEHDQVHLLVRPTGDGVVLGPLVVPGAVPCLNCLDLHARRVDPHWPQLLMQLSRARLPMPDLARRWAAATVVSEVLGYQHTGHSALLGRTATVRAPEWTPHWRPWRLHPSCLCHWDGQDVGGLLTAS